MHVKRDGKWLLDRVTDVDDDESDKKPPEPPPSNFEHLKELDWMVGSWVDKDEAMTSRFKPIASGRRTATS